MAAVLRNYSDIEGGLTGVDLSSAALERAAERPEYTDLQQVDLVSFCKSRKQAKQYDLIVCMDVFSVFSDLTPVFKAIKPALKPGGRLVFSVYPLISTDQPFLFDSGMFYHNAAFVSAALKSARLQEEYQQEGVLYRSDEDTPCLIFAAQKKK